MGGGLGWLRVEIRTKNPDSGARGSCQLPSYATKRFTNTEEIMRLERSARFLYVIGVGADLIFSNFRVIKVQNLEGRRWENHGGQIHRKGFNRVISGFSSLNEPLFISSFRIFGG